MTLIDRHAPSLRTPAFAGPVWRARLDRRAALDVSVDDELLRGELRGADLDRGLRDTLGALVAHELRQEEPLTERAFLGSGGWSELFPRASRRRRLESLIAMNLARRADGHVRPTVAGIAAVRQPSSVADADRAPQHLLRALRQAEIGRIGR